jgi:hypothetical protein
MMRRRIWTLTAAGLVALLATACSDDPAKQADGDGPDRREQAVAFAECMRDNGVGEFPDPDASGELTIDEIANHASIDTGGAAFERALAECEDLQPVGFTGTVRSPEQQEHALAFAQCIREHGVPDFPDPDPDDPLVDTRRIPSSGTSGGMEVLNDAMGTCGDEAGKAGVTG